MKLGRPGAFLLVFMLVAMGVAAYVYVAYGPASRPGRSPTAGIGATEPGRDSAPEVDPSVGPAPSLPAIESAGTAPVPAIVDEALEASPPPKELFFRHTGLDQDYGKLARVRLGSNAAREVFDLPSCEVVHVAGKRGLCLTADRGVMTTYKGIIFDTGNLAVVAEVPLAGVPSRCRVARDGRRAAMTVFVSGHGYADVSFSTQTVLVDLATGSVEADLESFSVSSEGVPFQPADRNFWGVTFSEDSRYFYATMSAGGEHYLIRGDAQERTARVIRNGVECPSLSPDGRQIAFKQRVAGGNSVQWQIGVLDLASGRQKVLAENRSVDDQLEWLDDARVLYSMPSDDGSPGASTAVWVARIDGSRRPELLLENAYSPAVLR